MISSQDDDAIARTVEILGNDGIVALPTETVYGLGASISSFRAIQRVFATKGRPTSHPLIVHLASFEDVGTYAADVSADARLCAQACWPGPFTMLVRRNGRVPDEVVGRSDFVALRVPANSFTRRVIESLGSPIAAPSANMFGRVSPTTAQHVCADLGSQVDLIVDDGPCRIGVESTIVDFTQDQARLVRPGGLPIEDVSTILGYPVVVNDQVVPAPGTLPVHYQPRAAVRVIEEYESCEDILENLKNSGKHVVALRHVDSLPLLASTLYAQLREADEVGADVIVAELPPATGLGLAVRDRLRRASSR
jgi:L-threonylcarbamoyladenylate synthase